MKGNVNDLQAIAAAYETKNSSSYRDIYNKYIKNVFRSSKKKLSQNIIKPIPSFLNLISKDQKNILTQDDVFIVMSFFPPISIKKVKSNEENLGIKWKIRPIFDVFYSNLYNYLISNSYKFYWFCWPGLSLQPSEQKELKKFLQENYKIIPIYADSMKIPNFIDNFCYKRLRPACQNLYDFFSSDIEFDDLDITAYNEINKIFAKESLKFLNKATKTSEKKNFIIMNYHLFRVSFYLRKTILKSNKIYKPFHNNISVFFNSGFPNPNNIKILGDYKKFLLSLLFADLLTFSIHDHAMNFCLNCQKYLQISHKIHDGGRIYLEFEGKIILINVSHPFLDYPLKDFHRNLNFSSVKTNEDLERIYQKYHDYVIIVSMGEAYESSMFEMKFQAFKSFCQKQYPRKFVLIQIIYSTFELCFIKRTEYMDKLSRIADTINLELHENSIEVVYLDKYDKETLNKLFRQTSIFLKLSLNRDENYMQHLHYLSINNNAITILSANLFETKAFRSIITINSLSINSIHQALNKAIELLNSNNQKYLVLLDRIYLHTNNLDTWVYYNCKSLNYFTYYHDKEFKLSLDKVNYEGENFRLMVPTAEFEEIEIKNILNGYTKSENRVLVFEFEGVFFDVSKFNAILNTSNILEIESKLNKCKPFSILSDEVLLNFKKIVQDPKNSVYIVSALSQEILAFFFPDIKGLTLFSENGYICQKIGRDEAPFINFYEKADTSWKAIVQTVIMEYVMKTKGSYLIEKKYSLIWIFDKVDKDFASIQAKELIEHLNEVLEFIEVIEIAKYENFIEVRLKNCQKVIFI